MSQAALETALREKAKTDAIGAAREAEETAKAFYALAADIRRSEKFKQEMAEWLNAQTAGGS